METFTPRRILILDDDKALCEILEAALTDNGFEVKILKSTNNIIEDVSSFQPDAVLLDYILPGINGGELCHQIKTNRLTKNIPVILFSAYARVLQSLGDYGCDCFVEKPFDLWDLLQTIDNLSVTTSGLVDSE